jgi:flagellar biosynthetic protein FlhB
MSEAQQEDKSQKTEQPTAKKLEDAKKKGNIPLSKEFNSFILFIFIALLIVFIFPKISLKAVNQLSYFIDQSHQIILKPNTITHLIKQTLIILFSIAFVPLLFCLIAAILGNLLQNGVLFVPEVIKFQLNRISIFSGFNRIFSLNSVVELVKGLVKIFIISIAIYMTIKSEMFKFTMIHTLNMAGILSFLNQSLKDIFITVCVIMFFIAALDFLYQRHKYISNLMMSKEELKKEYKESEGDPQIKSKLKSIRNKRLKERMMAKVPNADVVITNPTHYAVALKYSPENDDSAPIVVAKGIDNIALIIRRIAEENDVPIYEDPPLAQALYKTVKMDEEIPFEHYKSVAKIITEVMKLRGKKINV